MDADHELKIFLDSAGLPHLVKNMLEDGMTLDVLRQANEKELALLTAKVADKIKLRTALEKLQTKNCYLLEDKELLPSSPDPPVALLTRQNATLLMPFTEEQNSSFQNQAHNLLSSSLINESVADSDSKEYSYLLDVDQELRLFQNNTISQENSLGILQYSQESSGEISVGNKLRNLLLKETTGKYLLEKAEKGYKLNCRDRAYIVKSIVEAELKALSKLNDTIRRNVWLQWAKEISELFKEEPINLYYVPYHVIGGKIVQASGLIHNRLITHRRSLTPEGNKRRRNSESCSDHSESKRVRPLPEGLNISQENSASLQEQLDWLRGSSSPYTTVYSKWKATFELRTKLLENITYLDYFKTFPALQLPNGYQLLVNDFEHVHPSSNKNFEENFPLIKLKLLKLLAERGESSKWDQSTLDLLSLASVGEEQANLAAFLGIVALLRQMPTIAVPKKKIWKLSREEARNGFIARVSTPSEIEYFCTQREIFCTVKGIPNQPYIVAVGVSWANVTQYEVVISKGLRYQFNDVCSAVMHTFNIYWALDCAYPRESAPCWMLIQRAIFQITSKYDTEGVPLRELLLQLNVTK